MSKEARENKRLRIRQEHLIKAIKETESTLSSLISDINDSISLYKKKEWKPNAKHQEWLEKLIFLQKAIDSRKRHFKDDMLETVPCYNLEEFEC